MQLSELTHFHIETDFIRNLSQFIRSLAFVCALVLNTRFKNNQGPLLGDVEPFAHEY